MKIKISVIIPNYNGEIFLEDCLRSLLKEKTSFFEIIVVDDGSQDNSVKIVQKIKNELKNKRKKDKIILIQNDKNRGAAASRNIGAQKAKGEYLFFLDNDTTIKPGWSRKIITFFCYHSQAGMAQAKLLRMNSQRFDYAGDWISPLGFLIERARAAPDHGQFDQPEKIFALKSAAMVVRKNLFTALGGFDPDYHIF